LNVVKVRFKASRL